MQTDLPLHYFSSLQQLKFDAANAQDGPSTDTVDAMATQFESLFVNEMLKSMRATISENSLLGSDAINQYTEMYDQQLSLHIAQKGLGLKDLIIAQLGNNSTAESSVSMWENKDAFIDEVGKHIQKFIPKGIDYKAVLSIAALETGWGQHVMTNAEGKTSYNIFSIKADRNWSGAQTMTKTTEFMHGHRVKTHEPFRAYESVQAAIVDFSRFMQNPRYSTALSVAADGRQFIHELAEAGYATDPVYEEKLLRIYNEL